MAARRPAFPPRPLPRVCRRSACFWFDAKGVAGDYAGDAAASASSPPVEGPWRGPWACRRAARALLRGITRGRGRAPTHAVVRRQACDDVLWWHRLWAWGYYDRDGLGLPCWSTRSAAVAAALCLEIITFLCSKQCPSGTMPFKDRAITKTYPQKPKGAASARCLYHWPVLLVTTREYTEYRCIHITGGRPLLGSDGHVGSPVWPSHRAM